MGPNQEFKDELDSVIDHQLLPEERDFVRAPPPARQGHPRGRRQERRRERPRGRRRVTADRVTADPSASHRPSWAGLLPGRPERRVRKQQNGAHD